MGEKNKNYESPNLPFVVFSTEKYQPKERKSFFKTLCEHIADNIKQQKPIRDDMLLDFNKMVVSFVENNFSVDIASFEKLSQLILEYMRYGLENDDNKQRIYSYVRLSQMIDTLKTFCEERDIEIKAHQEALEHPEYIEIIRKFKGSKRITYKMPRNTDETTKKRLKVLKQKRFVIEGGINDDKYYILSKMGDALYRNLCLDFDRDWVDQWNFKRIFVLYYFLLSLSRSKYNMTVKDVTRVISECCESAINSLFEIIYREKSLFVNNVQKPNIFYSCFNTNSIVLTDVSDDFCETDLIGEMGCEEQKNIQEDAFGKKANA